MSLEPWEGIWSPPALLGGAVSLVSRGEQSSWLGASSGGHHEPSHLLPQVETNSPLPILSRTVDVPGIKEE